MVERQIVEIEKGQNKGGRVKEKEHAEINSYNIMAEEKEMPKNGEEFIKPHRHETVPKSPAPSNELSTFVSAPKDGIHRPAAKKPAPDAKAEGGGKKTRKCKNDATFVWLNVWYKNDFEKLGWMILAKSNGDHMKVEAYKNSVKRLYYQLDCKIRTTKDHDRKQDLMIMLKNVKCLLTHIHKDF